MNKKICFIRGLATLLLPSLTLAQIRDDQGHTASAAGNLEEIVVTAQKRVERLQDVPIAITTQNAAQLEAAGVRSTSDLALVVPGLVFAQNEAFVQPSIRGVTSSSTAAGAESPVAVYLDGIYQPSQNAVLFDLPDVDRIEVLKGPQGTLFGRNATGGALQIFTREPTDVPAGHVEVADGFYSGSDLRSANEVSVKGFVSAPLIRGELDGSVSAYYRNNPGYMTNDVDGSRAGKQVSEGVRTRLLWRPADNVKVLLSAYYTSLTDHAAYDRAPYQGLSVGANFADSVVPTLPWHIAFQPGHEDVAKTTARGMTLRADVTIDAGTLTSLTGYTSSENDDFVDSSGVFSPQCRAVFACLLYNVQVPNEAISQEFDFASRHFGRIAVTSGVFLYENLGAGENVEIDQGKLLVFGSTVKTSAAAVFAEVNFDVTDDLRAIVGGRYSHEKLFARGFVATSNLGDFSQEKDGSFTPRFSAIYKLTGASNVYFTYSKGFKSGVLPLPVSITAPTRPEHLTSYEAGFKTGTRQHSFNLSIFHYDYKDMQQTVFEGSLAFPKNAAAAKLDGVDVDGMIRIGSDVQLSTGFEYLPRAQFATYESAPFYRRPLGPLGLVTTNESAAGVDLPRAPRFTGNITANWNHEYDAGAFGANGTVYHSSEFQWDLASVVKTRSFEDIGASVYYEPHSIVGLRISVFGKNLLNKAHVIGSQPSQAVLPALYAAPRQMGIFAGYTF